MRPRPPRKLAEPKQWAGHLMSPHHRGYISEMTVCVDLLNRGFDVYRSVIYSGLCDIVAVNRQNEKTIRVEVKTARKMGPKAKTIHSPVTHNRFDVLALVYPDRSVEYRPMIDAPIIEWS